MDVLIRLPDPEVAKTWLKSFTLPTPGGGETRQFIFLEFLDGLRYQVELIVESCFLRYRSSVPLVRCPLALSLVKQWTSHESSAPNEVLDDVFVKGPDGIGFALIPGWYDPDKSRLMGMFYKLIAMENIDHDARDTKLVFEKVEELVRFSPEIRPVLQNHGSPTKENIVLELVLLNNDMKAALCVALRFGYLKTAFVAASNLQQETP